MAKEAARNIEIYIHLGFPKTGTTMLQQDIFPFLHEKGAINFLKLDDHYEALIKLAVQDPAQYDIAAERTYWNQFMIPGINLISYESLSGTIFYKSSNKSSIAHKLKELFPEARYILCFRTQLSMIYSLYAQYIHEGGSLPFRRFINCRKQVFFNSYVLDDHSLNLESLRFSKNIGFYEEILGIGKLHYMLFEEFRLNRQDFFKRLFNLLKLNDFSEELPTPNRRNPSYGRVQIAIARRLNRVFYSHFNRIGLRLSPLSYKGYHLIRNQHLRRMLQHAWSFKLLGGKKFRDRETESMIIDYFKEDNQELFEKLPEEFSIYKNAYIPE